jgi:hypothetical protein
MNLLILLSRLNNIFILNKKIMKTKILLFAAIGLFYFLGKKSYSQTPNWVWAKSSVNKDNIDYANSVIAVDASGYIYMAGFYSCKTITFDTITLTNPGKINIFLVKYDAGGNVLWAKSTGGKDYYMANAIAVDASGNIYLTGKFDSPAVFGSLTLTSGNIFLVKYDTNGNVIWAKSTGTSKTDIAYTVKVDASGNVYIAGLFASNPIIFGHITLTNQGGSCLGGCQDIFVAKYDENGNVLWAKSAGGTAGDYANSVVVDASGNVYIAGGFYSSTLNFGNITLTRNNKGVLNSAPGDLFLAKYDINGNVLWAKNAGGNNDDYVLSAAVDGSGNIYIAGSFKSQTLTLGANILKKANHAPAFSNIFLAKYNTVGDVLWAKCAGGKAIDEANSIAVDASGNIYMAGSFYSPSITFGTNTLKNARSGFSDIFLSKYDTNGNVLWAENVGEKNFDFANSVVLDASDNIYLTGKFGGPIIKFGSTVLKSSYKSSKPNFNIFLAKSSCHL